MRPNVTITRRSALVLAMLTVAGCRHKATPTPRPTGNPDATALAQARVTEQQLIAMYDAAIATATGDTADLLGVNRAAHAAHLAALGDDGATSPTAALPPFGRVDSLLRQSATSLRDAGIAAVDGHNAAVLASIAASHTANPHE